MSSAITSSFAPSALEPVPLETSNAAAVSAEERLLALIVRSQASQMDQAKCCVRLQADQLEKLREQVKAALDAAREAHKSAGFWGHLSKFLGSDLATLAGAVAAAAAVVASGGAAAAVLAAVAAGATLAADHAEDLGIPAEVAMAIAIVASVAGLCCGEAQGLLKVGASVSRVASDVQSTASVATAALHGGGAATGMVAATQEREAAHSRTLARATEGRRDLVSADIDDALDRLAASLEHQNSAAALASSIQAEGAASRAAILQNLAGAA